MTSQRSLAKKARRQSRPSKFRNNLKPSLLLLIIPLLVGAGTIVVIANGLYSHHLAGLASKRLVTPNYQAAQTALQQTQPGYQRKFAYYKVKDGQTLTQIATYFSVDPQKLASLNPGTIVTGTTIKVPPVEAPLTPTAGSNGQISKAVITDDGGMLRLVNKYSVRQPIVTTIPELAAYLANYAAIEQTGPTSYRINRPISLQGDIRLDITPATVTSLQLRSSPNDVTCLCFDESAALIDRVKISSYDPATGKADPLDTDGRSFIRMKNGRLDILGSDISYLGNGLRHTLTPTAGTASLQKEGGVYGASWRISDDQLGQQIATGWVEHTSFHDNHFGAYSYGASGITWRGNHFYHNQVYGLDPHDDSNNALIEDNVFDHNGKHGFIVSKRCDYNIIRNNTSYDNKFHGFMLHQDSAYNVIENNISYGNVDNFVIYNSNFNTIRNNTSYAPRSSHIRVNQLSNNTFITGNTLYGGKRGIFLYDGPKNTLITGNKLHGVPKELQTAGTQNAVFSANTIDNVGYDVAVHDRLIFGDNLVQSADYTIPAKPSLPKGYHL